MNIDRQAIKSRNYLNEKLKAENIKLKEDKQFWMKLAIVAMIALCIAMVISSGEMFYY